jgi:hypothetical protein
MFSRWKRLFRKSEADNRSLQAGLKTMLADRDNWRSVAGARREELEAVEKERDEARNQATLERSQHSAAATQLGAAIRQRDEARGELARVTEQRDRAWHAIEEASDAFRPAVEDIRGDLPDSDGEYRPDAERRLSEPDDNADALDESAEIDAKRGGPEDVAPFDGEDKRLFPPELTEPVAAAGLWLRRCSTHHYQICGGKKLVNFWPNAKKGFKVQVNGEKGLLGHTIHSAIALALGRGSKAAGVAAGISEGETVNLYKVKDESPDALLDPVVFVKAESAGAATKRAEAAMHSERTKLSVELVCDLDQCYEIRGG